MKIDEKPSFGKMKPLAEAAWGVAGHGGFTAECLEAEALHLVQYSGIHL